MKKRFYLLPLITLSLFSSSCSSSNKINYFKSDGNVALISTVNGLGEETDLIKMMALKNSFVFYISDPTCSSCTEFENMLSTYLSKSKLLIYKLLYSTYIKIDSTLRRKYSLPASVFTPALFIVKEGKIVNQLNYENNESKFTNEKEFEKYLSKFGKFTNNTYISQYKTSSSGETIYIDNSSDLIFDSSFNGTIYMYETLSNDYLIKLSNLDSSYYVSNVTSLITNNSYNIDTTNLSQFKTAYNIPSDISLPVLLTVNNGLVDNVKSM